MAITDNPAEKGYLLFAVAGSLHHGQYSFMYRLITTTPKHLVSESREGIDNLTAGDSFQVFLVLPNHVQGGLLKLRIGVAKWIQPYLAKSGYRRFRPVR